MVVLLFLLAWLSCLLASLAVAPGKKELGGLFDDVGSIGRGGDVWL